MTSCKPVLILVVFLTSQVVADISKLSSTQTMVILSGSPRDKNHSIVISEDEVVSLIVCVEKCSREKINPFSFYYDEENQICYCNNQTEDSPDVNDPDVPDFTYGESVWKTEIYKDGSFTKKQPIPVKSDCLDLYNSGVHEDGVYTIQPEGGNNVDVWCTMVDGGWTVFQRRQDGSENFTRGWNDYLEGFGNRTGEYWLGLDNLHRLTKSPSELNVSMTMFNGSSAYALFQTFSVLGVEARFELNVGGYKGTSGDSMLCTNNVAFATSDADPVRTLVNICKYNCGGWWYESCFHSNLNAHYFHYALVPPADGIYWKTFGGFYNSFQGTVMKMRRKV